MSGSPDSSNLMYVTKAYEEEVKNKAKRIYANDEVALSLDNLNTQLDNIVKEIDEKLGFVTNKIEGEYGVDSYVKAVHTQIDKVDIKQSDLVDESIKETKTHPSVMAFKSGRPDTKFNLYDFVNKSIEFNNDSPTLALHGSKVINPNESMLTFNFNTTSQEYLKIIEFSFTYKQYPDIVTVDIDKSISKETTVTVTRIISGRFFLIRHDPINHPDEFIIKAIINNSDNTGNILDRKFIDVQAYKDSGNFSYIFDDGPQFDLYFTFNGNNHEGLNIHIGKVLPYRYVVRKNYINTNDGTLDSNFKKIDMTIGATSNTGTHNIEDIYHSNNLACSFIVDRTRNEISILHDGDKFDNRQLSAITDIGHISGSIIKEFWVKDIGTKTFIRLKDNEHDTCYVGINNVSRVQDLGRPVLDVLGTSTNEILVRLGNIYYFFDDELNQISTNMFNASTGSDVNTFKQASTMIEYQDKYLIQFYTKSDGVYYCVKEIDTSTKKYVNTLSVSPEHKISVFPSARIEDLVPTNSEIMGFSDTSGIYLGLNYGNNSNGNESFVIYLGKLTVVGISYVFNTSNLLSVFNKSNGATSIFPYKINKFIKTRLFNFVITTTGQLYIFDESRIVKAVTFEEVPDKGWTDANSVLYMKPDKNQEEYFIVNNAYLQNVLDVVDTPNGVIIIDKKGVYALEESKNLVCKLYMDESSQILKYLPSMDIYGRFGGIISIDNPDGSIFKYSIYKNDYLLKEYSSNKLRYEYLDLFTSDYQLYDKNKTEYDTETPIVDFHAILYISFVDHLSVLYNSTGTYNITVNNGLTYGELNDPNYKGKKYTISTNKYGFIKYDNILDIDTSKSRISDINSIKKFKIIHRPDDNFTYSDAINTIHAMIEKEYEKYTNDTVYVKSSKTYSSNFKENKVFNNLNIEPVAEIIPNPNGIDTDPRNITITNGKLIKFTDTKYGRYGLYHQYNIDDSSNTQLSIKSTSLIWQSNISLNKDLKSLQTIGLYTKNIDLSPDINIDVGYNDELSFIETDDIDGTIYVTDNKTRVIESKAFPDGKFIIPFTIDASNGVTRGIKRAIKIGGDSGTVYFNKMLKTSDGEILAWNCEFGDANYNGVNKNIYRRTVAGNFEVISLLSNPFDTSSSDYNTAIESVIKVDGIYHVFGVRKTDSGNSTSYSMIYKKFDSNNGNKSEVEVMNSLIPDTQDQYIVDFKPFVNVYDFKSEKFITIVWNKNVFISKYDKVKKQFVSSIYPLTKPNETISGHYLQGATQRISFIEIEVEENKYEIYGAAFSNNLHIDYFYPNLFKLDLENDYFETLIPYSYNSYNYNTYDLNYDKYEKSINIISDKIYKYFIESKEVKAFKLDDRFTQTTFPYSTSGAVELTSSAIGEKDKTIRKVFSLASHNNGVTDNLFLCDYKENTFPREMYKLGNNDNLSSRIKYPRVATEYDSSKTYYKLDISRTIFNKYISKNFPNINDYPKPSLIKIFKREDVPNSLKGDARYVQIDKSIVKHPLIDFNYYKLNSMGGYDRTLDKTFNNLIDYYTEKFNYRLIDPLNLGPNEQFDNSAKYFTAVNPQFIECTDSDFAIDPDTNERSLKTDEIYYTFDEYDTIVHINNRNTRIIDNKLAVYAEYKDSEENTLFENNFLVYNLDDPDLFVHQDFGHKLLDHSTIFGDHGMYKIWDTKFGKFTLYYEEEPIDNNIKQFFVLVKLSSDYSIIEKIYDSIKIPSTVFTNKLDNINDIISLYEMSDKVFITVRYLDSNDNTTVHKTFVIETEGFEAVLCNVGHAYTHIIEFENTDIFGCDETAADTNGEVTKMKFYKYGVNGGTAFNGTPDVECNIGNNGFRYIKSVKHINSEGRLELFIFGIGSIHNIYRFYDGILEPYNDQLFQSLIYDENFTIVGDYYINYKFGVVYDIKNRELRYLADENPLFDNDKNGIVSVVENEYENIKETSVFINPSLESFVNYPDYANSEEETPKCKIYKLVNSNKDLLEKFNPEQSKKIIEEITNENSSYQNKIPMLTQLPLISKDGDLYYSYAKARTDNLLPDVKNKYDAFESNSSSIIRHRNCTFDKLILTSIGMFGIIKNNNGTFEIYLNENYSNSNGFTHVRDLQAWVEVPKAMPNIQECDDEIYLTYRDIYKFDKINHTFNDENKVLSFGTSVVYSNCTDHKDDKYEVQDELFTKLFITKNKDMYYYVKVDDIYTAYKYNKETKLFEIWFAEDSSRGIFLGEMTSIKETSLGVILLTSNPDNDYSRKNVVNLTRKEIMAKPPESISITYISGRTDFNVSLYKITDIVEFGEKRTMLLLVQYTYKNNVNEYEYYTNFFEYDYNTNIFIPYSERNLSSGFVISEHITKFVHEIINDDENNKHDIILLFGNKSSNKSPYSVVAYNVRDESLFCIVLTYITWDYTNNKTKLNEESVYMYSNTTGFWSGILPIHFVKNSKESKIVITDFNNYLKYYYELKFKYNKEIDKVEIIYDKETELPGFDSNNTHYSLPKLDLYNDRQEIYGIMEYNGIYILRNKDNISLSGFNIKEKEKTDDENGYKQIGYTYSVIAENKKKWNNELSDISNTLRDKYLLKVFGICRDNQFNESFIDNNNDYFSELDAESAKNMDLIEFYKKYYLTNWEKNKENHMFKKRKDIMNDMYISSSNTLNDVHIFDDEMFEIELNIFGSPVKTTDANEIDSMRLSTSWYLKRLNKHKPHLPYYPFDDA